MNVKSTEILDSSYNDDSINIDVLITVGSESKYISKVVSKKKNIDIHECNNNEEAINILKSILNKNDVVLLKASNSMNFKEIFEKIK